MMFNRATDTTSNTASTTILELKKRFEFPKEEITRHTVQPTHCQSEANSLRDREKDGTLKAIKHFSGHDVFSNYIQTCLLAINPSSTKTLMSTCHSNVGCAKFNIFSNRNNDFHQKPQQQQQQQEKQQASHMFSKQHITCTSVFRQQPPLVHQRQRKCSTLRQHQKQFLQLFICFMVIIRVTLCPEKCVAFQQPQQHQQQDQNIQKNQTRLQSQMVSVTLRATSTKPTTMISSSSISKNMANFLAFKPTITTTENEQLLSKAILSITTTTTTTRTANNPTRTPNNHNNSPSMQNLHTDVHTNALISTSTPASYMVRNDETKLAPILQTTISSSPSPSPSFPSSSHSDMSEDVSSTNADTSIVISTEFSVSKENLDFISSVSKHQHHHQHHHHKYRHRHNTSDQDNDTNDTPWRLKRSSNIAASNGVFVFGANVANAVASSSSSTTNIANMFHTHSDVGINSNNVECPSFDENSACPCYKFEDGLFLECPGTTALSLRNTLEHISSPVHSLSIYDFDRSVTSLSQDVFQPGVHIKHLQFSHSHLETLKDNSLKNVRASLESLSIVNGKLTQLPSRAFNSMQKLNSLDFDYNEISLIEDYSFYGLRLSKLNMKGNRLQGIPEYAFAGLEESMQEIDLSENGLRTFPLLALRKLSYLRILRLSNNKISTFYGDITLATNNASAAAALRLPSLTFLDLSSNQFTEIMDDCFRASPQLKTLSLYANQIEAVQPEAFKSLRELMSLDMSHNRIITLDSKIFERNKRLQTVDLSHNHIHSISGVFSNLPQLREIFLSENNILELSADAFTNSSQVEVIYLESNAIAHVDPNVFSTLINLDHLYLRANFIPLLPVTLLDKCQKLSSLSLDNNEIQDLEIGMFRKLEFLREVRLHNNRIRRIRKGVFEPLPALQELHVQKNNIEDIEPAAFETLTNLQHINLQDNQLTVLEDIFPIEFNNSSLLTIQLGTNYLHKVHAKTFSAQTKMQIMWLNDNQLVHIEKSLLAGQHDLSRLYLDRNLIRNIDRDTFANVKQLKFLDLSNNRLTEIRRDFFSNLENLEELNLAKNHIAAIEGYAFNKMHSLKVLDLSHNPLEHITSDVLLEELSLTHLNLRNTSLRKIEVNTFKSLLNLSELDLMSNFLSPADIQKLDVASLRSLYLSNNNFTHVGGSAAIMSNMFDNLRSLQHLTLDNCSIDSLPEQLFSKNTNLVKLNLCDNYINSLNRNLFQGLNVFKELRLCRNNLLEFPHIALYNLSTLEILDLSRNHFTSVDFYKLSGTLNLRQLNLKDNKITSLSGFNAVNLTQLDTMDFSGNLLLSLPANFLRHSINLQRVDLSSNRFLQIPSSALSDISIPRLSWLNLTGNPINKIYTVKEERYPYLKELYICQTNLSILTSKDFEAFQALQHLHLVNNRITRISPGAFKDLTNLLTLDISVNELEILPKERLQGLKLLRLLNISHNTLKDLEEFNTDLSQLQICDLSFNQLDRISRKTFRNLHSLTELYLIGNRMTVLSTEAFRYLRKLIVLDLRKNYFELISIEALQPLETNIKTLRLEENPLHCSCDAQKLWEWLRDHRKWSSLSVIAGLTSTAVSTMSLMSSSPSLSSSSLSSSTASFGSSSSTLIMTSGDNINYLRCEHPAELRGKVFAKMEPQQFCDAPLIPKIAIQDIQPYSVIVSWQSREHLGLNGYEIVYHAITDSGAVGFGSASGSAMTGNTINSVVTDIDEIRGKRLNGSANSAKLTRLMANTRYHICVIGAGNWLSEAVNNALQRIHFNESFLMGREETTVMMSSSMPAATAYSASSSSDIVYPVYQEVYGAGIPYGEQHSMQAQPQQQQALIENTINADNALQEVLKNSRFSTCTDVQTLDSTPSLMADENGLASNGFIHSILTRRLGLIVGCCLGIIVFIVMISVLSYVKLKKQRIENAKRQAAMPPDYMTYRHFSIPNEELLRSGTVMSSVPSGISAHISGTSLSMSASTNTATATTPLGILKVTENHDETIESAAVGCDSTTALMPVGGCSNLSTSTTIATLNATVSVAATTANNHNHHVHQHNHHYPQQQQQQQQQHQHHQQQQQQQQHSHQGNGNVVGYVTAGIVLGTNHITNVAC